MKDFRSLIKSITYFFCSLIVLIVVLFSGVLLFEFNPSLFIKTEISAKDWKPKDVKVELASGFMPAEVKYGYQLIAESPKYMGPMAEDPDMRYAGNNLACINCHLKAGTQAGSASWVGVTDRFPQFRGRSNSEGTIEDRINGCMERSMDGDKLPVLSREMKSIVAYMEWLGEGLPKDREKEFKGFPEISIPEVAVDLEKGKDYFLKNVPFVMEKMERGSVLQILPRDINTHLFGGQTVIIMVQGCIG